MLSLGLALGCASSAPPEVPQRVAAAEPAQVTAPAAEPAPADSAAPPSCAPLSVEAEKPLADHIDAKIPEIQDFSDGGAGLDRVYAKLATLARGGKATLRIGFWGDSNMTRDFISGELRRVLQRRFGDAGHGYIAVGKPWSWYIHENVRHGSGEGWATINMSTNQVLDRLYGMGGIAAQASHENARAWVATANDGDPVGTRASRIQVMYLRHPKFGSFEVKIDGKSRGVIETGDAKVSAGLKSWDVPDAAHRVDFVSKKAPVRLLGAVLERAAPGVVVDNLAIGGVNTELIARGDSELTAETLRMRDYDLVMLLTGATEPDAPSHDAGAEALVQTVRRALPNAAFLMMSPPDLAGGDLAHPTRVIRMNQIERRKLDVAREMGLLYWDFRGAMGGEQSIVAFAEHKMAWKDFIHLTGAGGHAMGRRFAVAFIDGFRAWLAQRPDAGCS